MAITTTSQRTTVEGSKRCIIALLTLGTSSEAWVTSLKVIQGFTIDAGSAAPTAATVSGGTLTITAAGSYTGASGIVWGY